MQSDKQDQKRKSGSGKRGQKRHEKPGSRPGKRSEKTADRRSNSGTKPDGYKKNHPIAGKKSTPPKYNDSDLIRLNKFISNAGICSRREADELIVSGIISVNGKVITEVGTKVKTTDRVKYGDQSIRLEKMVYLLLNKPKDFTTITDDPQNRKTAMALVSGACKEHIFPVGRLDKITTGLLLFTNDGDLAKILTHPNHKAKKIYHVFTDKNISADHLEQFKAGIQLDDGTIKAEEASFADTSHKQAGIEMHSGKHKVVRRMFEHFGYKVKKLDRVYYAGLTKKDLPRGKWRFLSDEEVLLLKRVANRR